MVGGKEAAVSMTALEDCLQATVSSAKTRRKNAKKGG